RKCLSGSCVRGPRDLGRTGIAVFFLNVHTSAGRLVAASFIRETDEWEGGAERLKDDLVILTAPDFHKVSKHGGAFIITAVDSDFDPRNRDLAAVPFGV